MQAGKNVCGVKHLASVSLRPMCRWCVWEEDAAESFKDRHRTVWTAVIITIDAQDVWVTTTVAGVASRGLLARESVLKEEYGVSDWIVAQMIARDLAAVLY